MFATSLALPVASRWLPQREAEPCQLPDFAAKVRHRMRYDRRPLLVTLQDKLLAKHYAAQRGVASAKFLALAEQAKQLNFTRLPANCFLKATHGCGWNILRSQGQFYVYGDGSRAPQPLSVSACRELCRKWLRRRYHRKEWAYGKMVPRIIAEETLQPASAAQLADYRCYTFGGVLKAIGYGSPQFRSSGWNVHFDRRWNVLDGASPQLPPPNELPAAPEALNQLIAAAEHLAAGLDFLRVDLYHTSAGVMLGELTVYPYAGKPGSPSGCPRFCQWLAEQWH